MRRLLFALLLFAAPVSGLGFFKCENTITIANINDSVVRLITHIDHYVLTQGYNCAVQLVPGDNTSSINRMVASGKPDIISALWLNDAKKAVEKGVTDQRLLTLGDAVYPGGEEGFWVPDYMLKHHGKFASINGIKQHASVFSRPQNPERGVFYGCRAGWACQTTVKQLFKALGLAEAKYDSVTLDSPVSFDQVLAGLYEQEQPWFGYYRSPSVMLAKYPMTKVRFNSGVLEEEFFTCTVNPACATPEITMYPGSPIQTVTTYGFALEAGDVFSYLKSRTLSHQALNALLNWKHTNNASDKDAALHFLMNYEEIWRTWVPRLVIGKVRRSLYPR